MELIIAKKIFQFFCHQMPERSFQFIGETFPLCFRCTGIYLGIFLSHLYSLLMKRYSKITPGRKKGLLLILLIFPLALDGFGDSFNIWNSSSEIRLITGLLAGVFISLSLISIPNIFKKKDSVISDLLVRDFLIPIIVGFVTIYLFINTNSMFTFNLFIAVVLIGWGIVISNILIFIYDSSKIRMNTILEIILFKNK